MVEVFISHEAVHGFEFRDVPAEQAGVGRLAEGMAGLQRPAT